MPRPHLNISTIFRLNLHLGPSALPFMKSITGDALSWTLIGGNKIIFKAKKTGVCFRFRKVDHPREGRGEGGLQSLQIMSMHDTRGACSTSRLRPSDDLRVTCCPTVSATVSA